ncbi:MAG: hypothetical protein HYX60_07865, partial [Legionella longbeachae]|nr:hypothetical protein [Legionella longbeachae]
MNLIYNLSNIIVNDVLNDEQLVAFVNAIIDTGNIGALASSTNLLIKAWPLLEKKQQRFILASNYRDTLLFNISIPSTSLKRIWESLSIEECLHILTKTNKGNTLLHKVQNSEQLKFFFQFLPEKEWLKVILQKDKKDGNTVLHRTVNHFESLKFFIESLPEKDCLIAFREINNNGDTVLHKIHNPVCLQLILKYYPENEHLQALKKTNYMGDTVLHSVSDIPECIRIILSFYPKHEHWSALTTKNASGHTTIHKIIEYPSILTIILPYLYESEHSKNERITELCSTIIKTGRLKILGSMIDLLITALPLLDEIDKICIINSNYFNQILNEVIKNPVSLKCILNLLSEKKRLAILRETDSYGNTLLHNSVNYPESLSILLQLVVEMENSRLIKEKNKFGETILDLAAKNSKYCLKIIWQSLSESEREWASKEKDKNEMPFFAFLEEKYS